MATALSARDTRRRTLPIGGARPDEELNPFQQRPSFQQGQQRRVMPLQQPQAATQAQPQTTAIVEPTTAAPTLPAPTATATTLPAQTTAPAPQVSSTTAPITQFTADQNLRSTQINPVASDATQRARALALQSLEGLADTPDRAALASDAFNLLLEQNADARRLGTQQIGRDAARLGRVGSGMVTTSLGDLEGRIRQSEDQAARALALDAAGSTMADRQAALSALLGGAGAFDAFDRADRGELRTERGRQDQLAQQSIQNFVQQQMLQDALLNSQFNRNMSVTDVLARIGYGAGNPSGSYLAASQQAGQSAANAGASVGQLLQLLALSRGAGGASGGGGTVAGDPVFGSFG